MIALLDDSDLLEILQGLRHYRKWLHTELDRVRNLSIEKDVYGWAVYIVVRDLARCGRIMLQLGADPED